MTLGIVILHWKNKERTAMLLNHLLPCCSENQHLYLVQNECNSDQFPDIDNEYLHKIISKINTGFGGGNNLALKLLQDKKVEFSLLVNSDATVSCQSIIAMVTAAKENEQIFALMPIINEHNDSTVFQSYGGKDIIQNFETKQLKLEVADNKNNTTEINYTSGTVCLLNNKHLKEIGLFDTDYFFSVEMADLCRRAKSAGYKCALLQSESADHFTESSPERSNLYRYYAVRNRFLFMRKFKHPFKDFIKWYTVILKRIALGIFTLNGDMLRTHLILLKDVLTKVDGNQNQKFINKGN